MCTVAALTKFVVSELRSIGIEESECRAEAELILTHFSGLSLAARLQEPERVLGDGVLARINVLLARRKLREPLQYCLGETHFYGLRFQVSHGVLIPRPDSEALVQAALEHFSGRNAGCTPLRLGEIGVGSGIISVVLLKRLPGAHLVACDISPDAAELARANAEMHGVSGRLQIACADWHDWLRKQNQSLDGIVANPPYIPYWQKENLSPEVRLWEPEQALFGEDDDGLGFYRDFAEQGHMALGRDALVLLEIGAGQSELVADIFCNCAWRVEATHLDLSGTVRVLSFVSRRDPFEIF